MAASLRQMSLLALRNGEKSMLNVIKTKSTMTSQTARTVVTTETGNRLKPPSLIFSDCHHLIILIVLYTNE